MSSAHPTFPARSIFNGLDLPERSRRKMHWPTSQSREASRLWNTKADFVRPSKTTVAADTATFTGVFPEAGYLTCDVPTFNLAAESLSDAAAVVTWTTVDGTIESDGPMVTATEPGLYSVDVTNPSNGCTTESDLLVTTAETPPVLDGGFVEPLTCLMPNQPVAGITIGDYAPFGTGNLTPVISWINVADGSTLGVAPASGSIGPIIQSAGTYQLTVEWQETGCASTLTVEAVEGEDFGLDISSITFPNILTANNDGKNDSWYPFSPTCPISRRSAF